MSEQVWTEQKIVALLNTSVRAVERGLVAIYRLQTEDEKSSETTKHTNGVGFSGADANTGSYLAKWVMSGKHLSGEFVGKGRKIALKYRKQLLAIALENQERKARNVPMGSGHCESCGSLGYGRIIAANSRDVVIVCNLCDLADKV